MTGHEIGLVVRLQTAQGAVRSVAEMAKLVNDPAIIAQIEAMQSAIVVMIDVLEARRQT